MDDMGCYEALIEAIIMQAIEEYRLIIRGLVLNPENRLCKKERDEIEAFFRSQWFSLMIDLDPEALICSLNMEGKE